MSKDQEKLLALFVQLAVSAGCGLAIALLGAPTWAVVATFFILASQ